MSVEERIKAIKDSNLNSELKKMRIKLLLEGNVSTRVNSIDNRAKRRIKTMYDMYNVFEVYEPFTNSNNYTYSIGETLEVVKVKDNTYVLTTDSIFADIRERKYKEIELTEEEINKKLLFIA